MSQALSILVRTAVLAAGVASLGACGQRGPLYLPEARPPATAAPAPTPPAAPASAATPSRP
ncbi:LPS translocon maturation chaperone LptM [Comamonas granuli]|uniref:LPS translocon maturation chaperone LptM n=1 Tax=Comamonas granuli TaxID=290309 RepID=UPI000A06FB52|nr:lipoprotein [Comamonas granuli]